MKKKAKHNYVEGLKKAKLSTSYLRTFAKKRVIPETSQAVSIPILQDPIADSPDQRVGDQTMVCFQRRKALGSIALKSLIMRGNSSTMVIDIDTIESPIHNDWAGHVYRAQRVAWMRRQTTQFETLG